MVLDNSNFMPRFYLSKRMRVLMINRVFKIFGPLLSRIGRHIIHLLNFYHIILFYAHGLVCTTLIQYGKSLIFMINQNLFFRYLKEDIYYNVWTRAEKEWEEWGTKTCTKSPFF